MFNLEHTFVSNGVFIKLIHFVLVNFELKLPITAPPPITPITISGLIFLIRLVVFDIAVKVLNPAFIAVNLFAACPPAWGIETLCHVYPFFLYSNPGAFFI